MVSLLIVFYLFVFLFAIIGAMRGWAKELLVIFSVILALAFITVIENLVPVIGPFITTNPSLQFWFRVSIVIVMAFFGYQSPKFPRLQKLADRRDKIQDVMLGFILGAVSGYFVIGTLWSFIDSAGYPFGDWIIPPSSQWPLGDAALRTIRYLPPVWLGTPPVIYIAVVLAFIFVIVVFV
jgi:hypothetical protein